MSAIALPAPVPSTPQGAGPRPWPWTVEEFHQVCETGTFEGRRPILIDGVILELGPMNSPHALAVTLVNVALQAAFGAGWVVRVQLPLALDERTDPLPDFAVVPGSPRDYSTHPTTASLIIEISDSSLALDLTTKAERYATANIADYWVLDLAARRLLVFREPASVAAGGAAYRTHLTLGPTESVAPLSAPTATIAVADLLP